MRMETKDKVIAATILVLSIIIFVLLVFFSPGCATAKAAPNSEWEGPQCQTLLNQRDSLTWATAFGSGLTGVGGLSTAISNDDRAQLGIGITTAVIGAVTSSLIVLSKVKSGEFETYCNLVEYETNGVEYAYTIKDGGL